MGGDHGAAVDHGVTQSLRFITHGRIDPHRFQTESRIFGLDTFDSAKDLTGINRQFFFRIGFALTRGYAHQDDAVLVRRQIKVVPDMHRLDEETKLL